MYQRRAAKGPSGGGRRGRVFSAYSHALHNDEGHTGKLVEGSYKAIYVFDVRYLRHLCRYIHANPVLHRFAFDPSLWCYSNDWEWIGKRSGSLVERAFVTAHFPTAEDYQAYVQAYLTNRGFVSF